MVDSADPAHRHIVEQLRRCAPPAMAKQETIGRVASAARWFSLPGGTVLFEKGDASDTIYLLLSGALGVSVMRANGAERMVGRLGPGEIVGEMGCITGEPRSATVRALRTCELLAISWEDLEAIAASDPAVLTLICRTVVQRLVRAQEGIMPDFRPRTFAIIPTGDGMDVRDFGEQFSIALSTLGTACVVSREAGESMTGEAFARLETEWDYVLFITELDNPAWSRRCVRQSDANIVVTPGNAGSPALPGFMDAADAKIPLYIAIMWEGDVQPGRAAELIASTGAARHFHIRHASDVNRLARLLTGSGFGLVLSGGGARGLAHIGVARALQESGIEIDFVMGTSIGGLVGAGMALQWDYETLLEKIQRFSRTSPLFDLTLPRQSLLAGRHLRASLLQWFGDLQLEDTPIPYSCVSTSLNSGDVCLHRSGSLRVWTAATTAIPGVFPPVLIDGVVHVDGGVLNNMPTDLIREFGAGFVVAIDVAGGALPADIDVEEIVNIVPAADRMNILELLARVGCIGHQARAATRRNQCDVLIVPDLATIKLLNFKAYQQAVDAGYRAAMDTIPLLEARRRAVISAVPTRAQL